MSFFNLNPNKSNIEKKNKYKEKIHNYYEFGAHFKYLDLYTSLINLYNILPSERLGNNGIYFQEEENNYKGLSNNTNFVKKIKISLNKNKNKFYFPKLCKRKLNINNIQLSKAFSPNFKNHFSSNQKSFFLNYMKEKPKHKKNFSYINNTCDKVNNEKKIKIPLFHFSKSKIKNKEFSINTTYNFTGENTKSIFLPKIMIDKRQKEYKFLI